MVFFCCCCLSARQTTLAAGSPSVAHASSVCDGLQTLRDLIGPLPLFHLGGLTQPKCVLLHKLSF